MQESSDTVPRPLQYCGADSRWGDAPEPRGMAVLSPAMIDALRELGAAGERPDLLEAVACCLRLGEPVLLSVEVEGWVWPITLEPRAGLYRAPLDWSMAPPAGLRHARLLACEPPSSEVSRAGRTGPADLPPCHYPLEGLLWTLALLGPCTGLLRSLSGARRFRAAPPGPYALSAPLSGALGSALVRLGRGIAGFEEICRWPGMDPDRATRLLNGLQLGHRLLAVEGPLEGHLEADSAWSDTRPAPWTAPPAARWRRRSTAN